MRIRLLLVTLASLSCLMVGCSRREPTVEVEPPARNDISSTKAAAAPTSATTSDPVSEWYRSSPVYVQGPGFQRCQQLQYVPSGLWGNSRPVDVKEAVSNDGATLNIKGTYADTGDTSTYAFYRSMAQCEQQQSAGTTQPRVKRGDGFKPFALVSKTNERISSETIESQMMCRNMLENLELGVRLVKEFQVIHTRGDDSMGMTSFLGEQGGKPVEVTFVTTSKPRFLARIYVDRNLVFSCE